jgi:aminoglycoside/choline kinase family phosphotransferase
MPNRLDALHLWLSESCTLPLQNIQALAGDASFRKYYRITGCLAHQSDATYIVMDAPSPEEKIEDFIKISHLLKQMDISTPSILKQNLSQGFLILEDFGDQLLLDTLTPQNVDIFYRQAMEIILQMQRLYANQTIPHFDQHYMCQEMHLFTDWFIKKHLNLHLETHEQELLNKTYKDIAQRISTHPQTFIHRDFHSRNLMVLPHQQLGVIDFQDAMLGPRTYDLVSLLKDCYIAWPSNQQKAWVDDFRKHLNPSVPQETLWQEFTLCGLQRHLKVLGIFCRIFYRDGKTRYMADLPLVWDYMFKALTELGIYPEFHQWICQKVELLFKQSIKPC